MTQYQQSGDGGLREALKEFQSTLEELLALGPVGDNGDVTWGLGYNRSTEHTLAAVRKMLAAAPAVPQPAGERVTKLDCGICYRDDSDPEKVVFTYLAECGNHGRY
jgi:hypothetical protein